MFIKVLSPHHLMALKLWKHHNLCSSIHLQGCEGNIGKVTFDASCKKKSELVMS